MTGLFSKCTESVFWSVIETTPCALGGAGTMTLSRTTALCTSRSQMARPGKPVISLPVMSRLSIDRIFLLPLFRQPQCPEECIPAPQIDRFDRSCYRDSMKVIAAYEAKSRFSEILRQAAAGEVFIITRNGRKMAELRACQPVKPARIRGMMKSEIPPIPAGFNDPLDIFAEYQ